MSKTQTAPAPTKLSRYRLLSGSYIEGFGHEGRFQVTKEPDGTITRKQIEKPRVVHKARGNHQPIVESATDLCKRFNRPGAKMFEKVADTTPLTNPDDVEKPSPEDYYREMTVKQLQAFALENEVDVNHAANKEEIIRTLLAHDLRV